MHFFFQEIYNLPFFFNKTPATFTFTSVMVIHHHIDIGNLVPSCFNLKSEYSCLQPHYQVSWNVTIHTRPAFISNHVLLDSCDRLVLVRWETDSTKRLQPQICDLSFAQYKRELFFLSCNCYRVLDKAYLQNRTQIRLNNKYL